MSATAHFLGTFVMGLLCFGFWVAFHSEDIDLSCIQAPGKEWIGMVVVATMIGVAWMLLAWR